MTVDPATPTADPRDGYHIPTIARRNDGTWGVICQACSDAAGDYVYPCRTHPDGWADQQYPPIVADAAALSSERAVSAGLRAEVERLTEQRDAMIWAAEQLQTERDAAQAQVQAVEADIAQRIETHAGPLVGDVRVGVSGWADESAARGYTAAIGEVLDLLAALAAAQPTKETQ